MTTKTARQALLDAADHIELVGLNQDGAYVSRGDLGAGKPLDQCRKCALGALGFGFGVRFEGINAPAPNWFSIGRKWATARDAIAEAAPSDYRSIPDWNDDPNTTQDEAVSTLRKAAELVTA